MRKMMLAVTGVGAGGVMLIVFYACILCQCLPVRAAQAQQPEQRICFPAEVSGVQVRAVQLARYEGPFCEDGTDDEVVDVAALVVENTGDLLVEEGAVVLEWEEQTMVFDFSFLLPGDRALVLEKERQLYREDAPLCCYGWGKSAYTEDMGRVQVEETGGITLVVINRSRETLPVVQVCYKSCDPGSGLLIGGKTYIAELRSLQPGERRVIRPYHYVSGCSKVISTVVFTET